MLPEVRDCYTQLAKAIADRASLIVAGPDLDSARVMLADIDTERIHFVRVDTNDTWTRDYGAITTVSVNVAVGVVAG